MKSSLFSNAANKENIVTLVDWFQGKSEALKGIDIGNDGEWSIVALVHGSSDFSSSEKSEVT